MKSAERNRWLISASPSVWTWVRTHLLSNWFAMRLSFALRQKTKYELVPGSATALVTFSNDARNCPEAPCSAWRCLGMPALDVASSLTRSDSSGSRRRGARIVRGAFLDMTLGARIGFELIVACITVVRS